VAFPDPSALGGDAEGMRTGSPAAGLALPLLCLVISPVQAVAIQLPILIAQDFVSVWAYRRNMHKTNFLYCLPGTMVGIAIGAVLATSVSPSAVQLMVGMIASSFVLMSRPRKGQDDTPTQPALLKASLWSTVAGFTSFIANAGGPPMQVYLMPQKLAPAVFAGTMSVLFGIVNWVKIGVLFGLGQISTPNLATSAALLPVAVGAPVAPASPAMRCICFSRAAASAAAAAASLFFLSSSSRRLSAASSLRFCSASLSASRAFSASFSASFFFFSFSMAICASGSGCTTGGFGGAGGGSTRGWGWGGGSGSTARGATC
jgi:uncharacterized membrane protein YfcA